MLSAARQTNMLCILLVWLDGNEISLSVNQQSFSCMWRWKKELRLFNNQNTNFWLLCIFRLSEKKLFYFDPHRVQPFVDIASVGVNNADDSYHCAYPSYMDICQLDPSIAIVCVL